MANTYGSAFFRIVDGEINMEVEGRYEAAYDYRITDPMRCGADGPPADLLNMSFDLCFKRSVTQIWPNGMTLAELENPAQTPLSEHIRQMLEEKWGDLGAAPVSVSLLAIKPDPASMALIARLQAMRKPPEERAKEMQRAMMQAQQQAMAQMQKMTPCPYCNSLGAPKADGSCPSCGAPMKQ